MARRIYRSRTDKIIGGVCGGLGDYFNIDPVLVRVITVVLILATGVGLIGYILAWIIIPKRPLGMDAIADRPVASDQPRSNDYSASWTRYLPGIVLITLGIILLIRENWFWFNWGEIWPVLLIAGGLLLIFHGRSRHESQTPASLPAGPAANSENNGMAL
ncbi:MAG TPA: PspC domain-containing protein [Candidatus Deferrimicrobium sp.]|nr:PspC domain-containing protein [Candidatus Deferrimicrobium sp.]